MAGVRRSLSAAGIPFAVFLALDLPVLQGNLGVDSNTIRIISSGAVCDLGWRYF